MNNKKIIGLLLSASMVITSVIPAFAAVTVDKTEEYNFGDSITITRDSSAAAALEITSEDGVKVLWDSFKDGEKTKTFKIPAADNNIGWTEGTYTVKTGDDTTTFVLAAAPEYEGKFVKWSDSSVRVVEGRTATVYATFSDVPDGATITFASADTSIATVTSSSSTGVNIYGRTAGTTSVTATLKDASGNTLAESTALTVTVVRDEVISNGGGSSSGSGGSGSIAGGNVSSSAGSIGITSRPDSYSVAFEDLGDAAWAEEAINVLAKKGIVSGYSDTQFGPNGSVTRAEFAKLIATLYNLVSANSSFGSQSFADVSRDAWYFNYVEVCAQLQIVNGYEDGNFYPNNLISRQEMVAMIYRAANVMGTSLTAVEAEKAFADAYLIHDYAKTPITVLQKAGIISGTSDTTFEPTAGCTRAQAATIIYNMYTRYAK